MTGHIHLALYTTSTVVLLEQNRVSIGTAKFQLLPQLLPGLTPRPSGPRAKSRGYMVQPEKKKRAIIRTTMRQWPFGTVW